MTDLELIEAMKALLKPINEKLELLRSDGVCAAINCQTIEKAPEWGFS